MESHPLFCRQSHVWAGEEVAEFLNQGSKAVSGGERARARDTHLSDLFARTGRDTTFMRFDRNDARSCSLSQVWTWMRCLSTHSATHTALVRTTGLSPIRLRVKADTRKCA